MHAREALPCNFFHDADDWRSSAHRSKRVRTSVARLQPDPGHICLETLELQHRTLFTIRTIAAAHRHFKRLGRRTCSQLRQLKFPEHHRLHFDSSKLSSPLTQLHTQLREDGCLPR
jgi:hypothetical protein